jgi:hypothetical protein
MADYDFGNHQSPSPRKSFRVHRVLVPTWHPVMPTQARPDGTPGHQALLFRSFDDTLPIATLPWVRLSSIVGVYWSSIRSHRTEGGISTSHSFPSLRFWRHTDRWRRLGSLATVTLRARLNTHQRGGV